MKVYVDELPKSCSECPCSEFNFDYGYGCNMLDVAIKDAGLKNESCPLQSLTDYTKQVRKEVCEEIRKKLKENGLLYTWKGEPKYKTMEELLDQIQGETK